MIVIGCRDRGYGNRAYLCVNGTYTQLDTTCDLDDDLAVSALYGLDTIVIIRSSPQTVYCGGWATWNRLDQDGYGIWVSGDSDADIIYGGTGTETQLQGAGGDDTLYNYSGYAGSWAKGSTGVDYVVGAGSHLGDSLYGDSGSDCLEDQGGNWAVFDCGGAEYDTYDLNGQSGTVTDCDEPVEECDFG
jgi:hypothetical protein